MYCNKCGSDNIWLPGYQVGHCKDCHESVYTYEEDFNKLLKESIADFIVLKDENIKLKQNLTMLINKLKEIEDCKFCEYNKRFLNQVPCNNCSNKYNPSITKNSYKSKWTLHHDFNEM